MKSSYLIRLRNVLTFFAILIGIPYLIALASGDPRLGWYICFVSWAPALFITGYLNDFE